eukprot:3934107-Rhodomonas_salina.1
MHRWGRRWTGADGYHRQGRLCYTKRIVWGNAGPGATAIIVGGIAWISLSSYKLQVPPSSS